MNGNSYVDIFATKGIEYILVLAFLAALIVFWKVLNMPARRRAVQPVVSAIPSLEKPAVADNLFYAPGHSWAGLDAGGTVSLGIDSFLGRLIGKFEGSDMPEPGTEVRKGDPLLTVSQGGRKLTVAAPLSGIVKAVNTGLAEGESLAGEESAGWVARIEPTDLARELSGMRFGARAKAWLEGETARLRDFISSLYAEQALAGDTLLDGGLPAEGALWMLSKDELARFAGEFLETG